jgi:hypothetical protein
MGATEVSAPGRVSKGSRFGDGRALTRLAASVVLPPIRLTDGTVEGLKWIGLVLMTLDHVNKYLFHEAFPTLFSIGRLSLPIFGLVLAYNLARPGALALGIYPRTLVRLAAFGMLAEAPFIALGGLGWGWWPLNILFMLLTASTIMWLIDSGGIWRVTLAVAIFVVGGAFVEFWWPALAMCLAAWSYCRRPSWWSLGVWFTSVLALWVINRNCWALAAFPLIFYAPHASWKVPRYRYVFYIYYPAHLSVILGIAILLKTWR